MPFGLGCRKELDEAGVDLLCQNDLARVAHRDVLLDVLPQPLS
jgi:hypothetical protein